MQMVPGLVPGAIRTILAFGTDDQKARMIPPLASGEWLATMCLTEPGAGSDLSRIRCRATETGGWRIDGEKIFISGGDQDASEGILHLVLARTSDDGIKGLSLFLCRRRRRTERATRHRRAHRGEDGAACLADLPDGVRRRRSRTDRQGRARV
jgi:alkylation response protein AidB-like acyl-CoA dehydrogenase